jgi:hypothetical protein
MCPVWAAHAQPAPPKFSLAHASFGWHVTVKMPRIPGNKKLVPHQRNRAALSRTLAFPGRLHSESSERSAFRSLLQKT